MKLYLSYLSILFKSQLQYRSTLAFLFAAQVLVPLAVFAGILSLFQRFGTVAGWTAAQVCVCYGVTHMAFALAQCFARGLDVFSSLVRLGDFDRILVRPRGTLLQVLGSRLDLSRFGRVVQGAAVLVWAASGVPVAWDGVRIFVLVSMVLSGTVIFSALYLLGAALCFRTVQGLEVVNIFTDGGRETAQYPLSIYPRALAGFFTFVVPFACFNTIPLLWVLGKPGGEALTALAAPWAGMLFWIPAVLVWRWGVRHYLSTGS
jgi:ABC-2 type transport system permease protein